MLGDVSSITRSARVPYWQEARQKYLALYRRVYAVSRPVFLLFARGGAAGDGAMALLPRRRMNLRQFFMTFVMTMGVAYACNYVGVLINHWFSRYAGGNPMDIVYPQPRRELGAAKSLEGAAQRLVCLL